MIIYEYPLNERIRTLLRLEGLYHRTEHFINGQAPEDHHAALIALFAIVDLVSGRPDLRGDLIQELERQRQHLTAFRNYPEISEEVLSGALHKIEQASSSLLSMTGRLNQYLRENEWLSAVHGRVNAPGGVCESDLPFFRYWLHQDSQTRRDDLQKWLHATLPVRDGLSIVLNLLRTSGKTEQLLARNGQFQVTIPTRNAQLTTQLLRVQPASDDAILPEISANKYALNIRFMKQESTTRPIALQYDILFSLTFCRL